MSCIQVKYGRMQFVLRVKRSEVKRSGSTSGASLFILRGRMREREKEYNSRERSRGTDCCRKGHSAIVAIVYLLFTRKQKRDMMAVSSQTPTVS
jgi:hypothetical protein